VTGVVADTADVKNAGGFTQDGPSCFFATLIGNPGQVVETIRAEVSSPAVRSGSHEHDWTRRVT